MPLWTLRPARRVAWSVAWACLASLPLPTAAADNERAHLAQQRRQLSEAFAAEERLCTQRFAVTACVDALGLRRREALAPLRERELQLDEAERVQRAAERLAAIAAKRAAAASAPPDPSAAAPELRVRPAAPAASRPAPRPRDDGDERAAQAEQRQRQAQQRREEAAAAQQRVQRRQHERDAGGRKSDPLPVPAPASAPRR